jgi:hypothetical protein
VILQMANMKCIERKGEEQPTSPHFWPFLPRFQNRIWRKGKERKGIGLQGRSFGWCVSSMFPLVWLLRTHFQQKLSQRQTESYVVYFATTWWQNATPKFFCFLGIYCWK